MKAKKFLAMLMVGAAPTAMALGDVYTATQQGTIDGMENPMATLYGQAYYEVTKYITMIDYIRMPVQWVTSESWYQGLTEEQQIICESGDEAGRYMNQKMDEMLEHPEKMDEVADALVAEIIDFANGKATKSESLGFYELAIARVCNYV